MITYKKRVNGSYQVFHNDIDVAEIFPLRKVQDGNSFRYTLKGVYWAFGLPTDGGNPSRSTATLKDALHQIDALMEIPNMRNLYTKAIDEARHKFEEAIKNFKSNALKLRTKPDPVKDAADGRANERWTEGEEYLIKQRFNDGMSVYRIGEMQQRTIGAVIARLQRLKLIEVNSATTRKYLEEAKKEASVEIERIRLTVGI